MTTKDDLLATANFQLMKADIHIQTMTTEADQLRATIDEQAATIARLTAAHAMQGEELVTLPRHMVYSLEDKLKAQAEEIRTLKQALENKNV